VIDGNPFKQYSKYDFELPNSRDINISVKNAEIKFIKPNILIMKCMSDEYHLSIKGFDPNRDLIVEARTVEPKP